MMTVSFRTSRFYILPAAFLLLAGCSLPPLEKPEASAEQEYASVSAPASGEEDPLQEHLRARARVNPNNMGEAAYTKHVSPPGQKPADPRLAEIEEEVADMNHQTQAMADTLYVPEPTHKPSLIIDGKRVITQVPARQPVAQPVSTGGQEVMSYGAAHVLGVRLGDHPDKTRLVLDLDARAGFQYELDNAQHALRINLPGTAWNAEQQKILPGHPLIAGYAARPLQGGGTSLVIALKKNARVILSAAYPPDQGKSDRIVFDIAPG